MRATHLGPDAARFLAPCANSRAGARRARHGPAASADPRALLHPRARAARPAASRIGANGPPAGSNLKAIAAHSDNPPDRRSLEEPLQLEQLGTPVEVDSPHRRYAALHRAIDSGMASDATWRELVNVCLLLEHRDEALRAFRRLTGAQARRDVEALLIHRGLLEPEESPAETGAPATAAAPGLREETLEAARVLLDDHMPLTTAVATLTFPLVVGLGGFLTAGHSFFLFPLIAALPALCVVGIVGALSRGIMVDSAHGVHDVPRIPGSAVLVRQSARFLLDGLVLVGALAGPAIAMHCLGLALSTTLLAAALAALLLPMALLMRQITDDWRALSPNHLFRAIGRLRGDYLGRAAVCAGLFLPAALAAIATAGSLLYLQVSVVGPLLVAPLFVAARLLGRMVDLRRDDLRDLLDLPARSRSEVVGTVTRAVASTAAAPASRTPVAAPSTAVVRTGVRGGSAITNGTTARPQAAASSAPGRPAPVASKPVARDAGASRAGSPSSAAARPAVASSPAPSVPARAAPRREAPTPRPQVAKSASTPAARPPAKSAPKPAAAKPPAPATPAPARIEVTDEPLPDFTAMSGYHIVQGKARVLAGAAATPGSGRHRAQP